MGGERSAILDPSWCVVESPGSEGPGSEEVVADGRRTVGTLCRPPAEASPTRDISHIEDVARTTVRACKVAGKVITAAAAAARVYYALAPLSRLIVR
jgi:hypothetical protein